MLMMLGAGSRCSRMVWLMLLGVGFGTAGKWAADAHDAGVGFGIAGKKGCS